MGLFFFVLSSFGPTMAFVISRKEEKVEEEEEEEEKEEGK